MLKYFRLEKIKNLKTYLHTCTHGYTGWGCHVLHACVKVSRQLWGVSSLYHLCVDCKK